MASNNYNAATSKTLYFPDGTRQIASFWSNEKTLHDLAEIGVIRFFEGPGPNPMLLTGASTAKAWLRQSAGVQTTSGEVRVYVSGDATDENNWEEMTPETFSDLLASAVAVVPNFHWNFDGSSTSGSGIGAGNIRANNANWASATRLYVHKTGAGGESLGNYVATWDDVDSLIRGTLQIFTATDRAEYLVAQVTGALVDGTTYYEVPISVIAAGGTPETLDALSVSFIPSAVAVADVTSSIRALWHRDLVDASQAIVIYSGQSNSLGSTEYLGHQLLTQTDALNHADWTKTNTTITTNATTAPSGEVTAEKILETTATGVHEISQVTPTMTITGVTQANPPVVTVSSSSIVANGQTIVISGVAGMTQLNGNSYVVRNKSTSAPWTFELEGADSRTFTAYSSGGSAALRFVQNQYYVLACYVKAAERSRCRLLLPSAAFGTTVEALYDLSAVTATVVTAGTNTFATIQTHGDGWYRIVLRSQATASDVGAPSLRLDNGSSGSYTGVATSGLFAWNLGLWQTSTVTIPTWDADNQFFYGSTFSQAKYNQRPGPVDDQIAIPYDISEYIHDRLSIPVKSIIAGRGASEIYYWTGLTKGNRATHTFTFNSGSGTALAAGQTIEWAAGTATVVSATDSGATGTVNIIMETGTVITNGTAFTTAEGKSASVNSTPDGSNREAWNTIYDSWRASGLRAAGVPAHFFIWVHGEADTSTRFEDYIREFQYLLSELERIGAIDGDTRIMTVGTYHMPIESDQFYSVRYNKGASKMALTPFADSRVMYVDVHGIQATVDSGGSDLQRIHYGLGARTELPSRIGKAIEQGRQTPPMSLHEATTAQGMLGFKPSMEIRRNATNASGAIWRSGTTVPATTLGNIGDFYNRTSTSSVYWKRYYNQWIDVTKWGVTTEADGEPAPDVLDYSDMQSQIIRVEGDKRRQFILPRLNDDADWFGDQAWTVEFQFEGTTLANPVLINSVGVNWIISGTETISTTSVRSYQLPGRVKIQRDGNRWRLWNDFKTTGNWTPTFTFSTPGNLSNVYTVQSGTYKIDLDRGTCRVTCLLQWTPTHTTASGTATIAGLPFAAANGFNTGFVGRFSNIQMSPGAIDHSHLGVDVLSGATAVNIRMSGHGATAVGTYTTAGVASFPTGVQYEIRFEIEYDIAV